MNQEKFNQICINELNSRINLKRQRGMNWGEQDDKKFMNWFVKNTNEVFGLDLHASRAKFLMFMIQHSTLS